MIYNHLFQFQTKLNENSTPNTKITTRSMQ